MVYVSDDIFVKVLLFLLIFTLVFISLTKLFKGKNKVVVVIISLVISLLTINYLSFEQLNILNFTYTLFGTIVLMAVPFLIAFYFIYSLDLGKWIRRIFWIFFFTISFLLLQKTYISPEKISTISTILILLAIGILIFDKIIKKNFNKFRK